MTVQPAGTTLPYTVTWLEMTSRPVRAHTPAPAGDLALLRADAPPVWYFLTLYDAVGREYAWEDAHARDRTELDAWLKAEAVALYTLMGHGYPQGFFLLDATAPGVTDLAYFGLVPEAVGRGLGRWLLQTAIDTAWSWPDTTKLTVNTCTLDHPRALRSYQAAGFTPVRRETRERTLTRDRDLSRIPA